MIEKRKRGRPADSFVGVRKFVNGKKTRTYSKWCSMIARCKATDYRSAYYFKRGIKVCPQWCGRNGFKAFLLDMGECPPGLTLERRDNDRGYSPGNCYWATWKQQANNRSVGVKPNPESIRNKSKLAGLPYHVVYQRIKLRGWDEAKALSTPVQPRGRAVGWRSVGA